MTIDIKSLVVGSLFLGVFGFYCPSEAREDLKSVEELHIPSYLGDWYEIARIPQFFQRKCERGTKAQYSLIPGSEDLQVENSCVGDDEEVIRAEGRARRTEKMGQLEVTFVHLLGKWFFSFGGDYWVIQLDPEYRWAVVGHPDRTYGWILSRSSLLEPKFLKKISENLEVQGYDTCLFKTTLQEGGIKEQKSLCEYIKTI